MTLPRTSVGGTSRTPTDSLVPDRETHPVSPNVTAAASSPPDARHDGHPPAMTSAYAGLATADRPSVVAQSSEDADQAAASANPGPTPPPAGESDIDLPRYVGRSVRRYRLEVEIIDTGNWRDIQAEVSDAVADITPGAAYAVDLTEETLLVPDGNGEPGSRCA